MEKISQPVLELIREYNKYDLELYSYAQEIFQKQLDDLKKAGYNIPQEVDDYKNNKGAIF